MNDGQPCLVQFTDMHIYGDPASRLAGMDTRQSFNAVVEHARTGAWPPDAVVVTGDLTMDGSTAAYMWLRERLETLGVPVYCIPGNHDEPAAMREVMPSKFIQCEPVIDFDRWRVVLLDSFLPQNESGEIGAAQLDWLSDELASSADRHVLIALHHPPVSIGSTWMDAMSLNDAAAFWGIVGRVSTVRCVLWGHIHQNYEAYRGPIRLLGSPSTCVQFAPRATRFERDPRPPAYRHLKLCADGHVKTQVRRISGNW